MSVFEAIHPIWGSNFSNQLKAADAKNPGDDGNGYIITIIPGLFGGKRRQQRYVGDELLPATDGDNVKRHYRHKCELLRIVMMPRRYSPSFIVFMNGHITSEFDSDEIEIRIMPEELVENNSKPTAEVWFHGEGLRYGPLNHYDTDRVICTFASQEQLNAYLGVIPGANSSES